jgi:hypothetical protein
VPPAFLQLVDQREAGSRGSGGDRFCLPSTHGVLSAPGGASFPWGTSEIGSNWGTLGKLSLFLEPRIPLVFSPSSLLGGNIVESAFSSSRDKTISVGVMPGQLCITMLAFLAGFRRS